MEADSTFPTEEELGTSYIKNLNYTSRMM